MENVGKCDLCGSAVNNSAASTVKSVSSLTTYLYHKNVRETLLPSSNSSGKDALSTKRGVPVMTFTFSLDGTQSAGNVDQDCNRDTVLVCGGCQKEIRQLELLHQQLESCKKLITAQVERIESICEDPASACTIEESRVRNHQREKSILRGRNTPEFGLDVSLAGTSIGKENISQVLRCLEALCGGVSSPKEPPSATLPRSEGTTNIISGNAASIDQDSNIQPLSNDFDPSESILPEGIEPHPPPTNFTYWDSNATTYSTPSSVEMTVDEEKEEMFVHTIKLDPAPNNDFIDESDQIDPYLQPFNENPFPDEDNRISSTSKAALRFNKTEPDFPLSNCRAPTNNIRKRAAVKTGTKIHRKKGTSLPLHTRPKKSVDTTRFGCEMCWKSFPFKADLIKHIRTHTGEKPFKCEICSSCFAQSSSLLRHIRSHRKRAM